jgi:hypothetical protein
MSERGERILDSNKSKKDRLAADIPRAALGWISAGPRLCGVVNWPPANSRGQLRTAAIDASAGAGEILGA